VAGGVKMTNNIHVERIARVLQVQTAWITAAYQKEKYLIPAINLHFI
jgi:hypothetical protein